MGLSVVRFEYFNCNYCTDIYATCEKFIFGNAIDTVTCM